MKKVVLISLLGFFIMEIMAQENIRYQVPSEGILQLADYERAPRISMDTRRENMLLSYTNTYKTLEDLNQEEMRLAGLRINPDTRISSAMSFVRNLKLRRLMDPESEPLQVSGLPVSPRIAYISWSPDDSQIAFTHTAETGVELWVVDVVTAAARRITEARLNCTLGSPYVWYGDSRRLLVKMLPEAMPPLVDRTKTIPAGPVVSASTGEVSQNRTYQDLLKNRIDEQNFETLVTSELFTVSPEGEKELFLDKGFYASTSFSPDGKLLLVTELVRPWSYLVTLDRFPQKSTVFDLSGQSVKVVNALPLAEITPKGFSAVRAGRRIMGWREDLPSTLFFVVAPDQGDPAVEADYRDEVYTWDAPFDGDPALLARLRHRYSGVSWGDTQTAVFYDSWMETRRTNTYLVNPSLPGGEPKLLFSRNAQDIYSDPGRFQLRPNRYGRRSLVIERGHLFLIGEGYTAEGQFPFIDELSLKTLTAKRVYRSHVPGKKEEIQEITDYKKGIALVQIQSPVDYPNYYLRHYKTKAEPQQLTHFPNPFESIRQVEKQVIRYQRADGVELSGTLYLPPGYDKTGKEKLPLLIWAYPVEYKDRNSAGQSRLNPYEFTFPNYGSFIFYVVNGYAVLDDASFPIVGEGENEPNDTFVEQLVANGRAAIDAVDQLGFIDRTRVAVGGHSYGAFMTAHLLTWSDDFACGIARSGAYNRTLTPFGFQREARNYWDAPDVYNTMSPFQNAAKMKKPILLVHGEADNNPGTFTLQTERYFQAIKGLGGDARMVLLPMESHSYVARENILHLLWEQEQFLDKNLKKEKK